ncbi:MULTISPECIES: hypothetical protein [Pseudomonas]|uniref:hypothetical protein n=2 Tax=Pseudomonas TaxID=286 RepID=UPI0019115391|nr:MULTISPECIES: hypothetical protein [Pseudomonas]
MLSSIQLMPMNGVLEMAGVVPEILDALNDVWGVPPSSGGFFSEPAFKRLEKVCSDQYEQGKHSFGLPFALSNALRSLGAPCSQTSDRINDTGDIAEAASKLDAAFGQTKARRIYICPLNYAEDIPSLAFGAAKLGRFKPAELELLFDKIRLARHYPSHALDTARLCQFHWLVIEETVAVPTSAGQRALPDFSTFMERDSGAINPHESRFPTAVERVLFFLLLAPWEEWSTMNEESWRGFEMPWVYCRTDDIFDSPSRPPDPDSLAWEPFIYDDEGGEAVEIERPIEFPLTASATREMSQFCEERWVSFQQALDSELLKPPVMHFLVRAFLADGIDEFMAHLTSIEAALGLQGDHNPNERKLHHKNLGATKRVGTRLAALLDDATALGIYADLYHLRSAFIHGRGGIERIPTQKRVEARRLAAACAAALVEQATRSSQDRESFLRGLLDKGVQLRGT